MIESLMAQANNADPLSWIIGAGATINGGLATYILGQLASLNRRLARIEGRLEAKEQRDE